MRKTTVLTAAAFLLMAIMAATVFACGGSSSTTSSATAASLETTTTSSAETTLSTTDGDVTTISTGGESTTSIQETTTTTEASRTTDTYDHASEFQSQYPSSESFDTSTWATLSSAPASHLGAAVDVKGVPANVTVDPDSKYLTWQLTITGTTGQQMKAVCRTNVNIDRTLLSAGGTVEVKGLVVGAQPADAGGGAIIYVESVQKAA